MIESDGEIARKVTGGEREAYSGLVQRHQARLRSLLSRYCRSSEEVEEFLQQAFVEAYLHLDQYDAALPFYPWLKTIATNALRMEMRRKSGKRQAPAEYLRHVQMSAAESEADVDEADSRCAALRKCFEQLPQPQAELLTAKYHEGRSIAELAERLCTTLGALSVRLLRLRETLKKCIDRRLATEAES